MEPNEELIRMYIGKDRNGQEYQKVMSGDGFKVSAFLLSGLLFLAKKMYLYGAIICFLEVVLDIILYAMQLSITMLLPAFFVTFILPNIFLGLFYYKIYRRWIFKQIQKNSHLPYEEQLKKAKWQSGTSCNIITVLVIIVTIVLSVYAISFFENNIILNYDGPIVKYSVGGGFGRTDQTATINVEISSKKAIISYNAFLKKEISVDEKKFNELIKLINEKFYSLNSDLSNKNVLDGGSSKITVSRMPEHPEYTVGGYGVWNNKDYEEIEKKIREVIGKDTISNFRKNEVKKMMGYKD